MLSGSSSLNTSLAHIYVILYLPLKSARTNTTYYTICNVTVGINEATAKVRGVYVLRINMVSRSNEYKRVLVLPSITFSTEEQKFSHLTAFHSMATYASNAHYRRKLKLDFLKNVSNLCCFECSDQLHVLLFSVLTIFIIATSL